MARRISRSRSAGESGRQKTFRICRRTEGGEHQKTGVAGGPLPRQYDMFTVFRRSDRPEHGRRTGFQDHDGFFHRRAPSPTTSLVALATRCQRRPAERIGHGRRVVCDRTRQGERSADRGSVRIYSPCATGLPRRHVHTERHRAHPQTPASHGQRLHPPRPRLAQPPAEGVEVAPASPGGLRHSL